jgi:glycosyltransferase involved in cell wall biosynthesis
MNILFLNYEFPPLGGGASPVSLEIARGYVRKGHSVDVVTMSYKDLPFYESIEGINVYRVKSMRLKKEICHPWEQLSYLISAWRFLKRRMGENTYDINHTHFIIPTGVLALRLKRKYGLPYILTSHGSDVLGYNKRFTILYSLLKRPWKNIIRESKCVTAPSDFLIDSIKSITTDGRFQIITNGLDLKKFRPLKKEKRILVVARLFWNKGIHDILDAIRGMDMHGWTVAIVGEGPYREDLEKKIKENNLSNTVRLIGWLDNNSKEMKELYGKAGIFISASYFESFGLTVLEALSAGCYPLISDIGGHRYILNDDRYFFQKGNIVDLREKLSGLLTHEIPRHNVSLNRFSWMNVIKEYIALLEK